MKPKELEKLGWTYLNNEDRWRQWSGYKVYYKDFIDIGVKVGIRVNFPYCDLKIESVISSDTRCDRFGYTLKETEKRVSKTDSKDAFDLVKAELCELRDMFYKPKGLHLTEKIKRTCSKESLEYNKMLLELDYTDVHKLLYDTYDLPYIYWYNGNTYFTRKQHQAFFKTFGK